MKKARGIKELIDFKAGKELSRKEAILAFCADCMNLYPDEIRDCDNPRCPLYKHMPYCKTP